MRGRPPSSSRSWVEECTILSASELKQTIREIRAEGPCHPEKAEIRILGLKVEITSTRPNFGGERWWYICPHCRRRVGNLYTDDGQTACRTCLALVYRCQYRKGWFWTRLTHETDWRRTADLVLRKTGMREDVVRALCLERLLYAYLEFWSRIPRMMEEVAERGLSHTRPCSACRGQEGCCAECDGSGQVTVPGDLHAVRLVWQMQGLIR